MNKESLKFAITLSGTFWDRRPQYSIWFDDQVVSQSELSDANQHTFTFTRDLVQGPHEIKIRLENKIQPDTVLENGHIVKDMLLNIDDIVIDDTSVGNLLYTAEYQLDKPQNYQGKTITHLDHCVNLGWNGTYIFKFSSPFTAWLLERL
jgi:hypothetical protein